MKLLLKKMEGIGVVVVRSLRCGGREGMILDGSRLSIDGVVPFDGSSVELLVSSP